MLTNRPPLVINALIGENWVPGLRIPRSWPVGVSATWGDGKAQKDLSKVRLNGCGCVQRLTID